jgi:sirohydrochlorin ferrochelatase
MTKRTNALAPKLQAWVQARERHRLSHAQVQMARELGMNPTKLGSIDNHRQERWKAPLPQHIEHLYLRRFGRDRPEVVVSIEERARQLQHNKAERKAARRAQARRRDPDGASGSRGERG